MHLSRKAGKVLWQVVSVLLMAISLSGLPRNLATWARWLEPFNSNTGRWLLVTAGVLLLLWTYDVPQRLRTRHGPIRPGNAGRLRNGTRHT